MRKRAPASFDPKRFLARVGDGKSIAQYLKNEIIFSQGAVADAVFYIQRGNVKLVVISKHGKEAVVAILGPGHFFGEGCLNGHPLRIATARAVDQCVITRLEKKTMIATIHREPGFSEVFMSYLLTRNSRIEEDSTSPSCADTVRVINFLPKASGIDGVRTGGPLCSVHITLPR